MLTHTIFFISIKYQVINGRKDLADWPKMTNWECHSKVAASIETTAPPGNRA